MAKPGTPQDESQAKKPAKSPTSPDTAIEKDKIEISKEDLEKVSGGQTPSRSYVVD